MKKEIIKDKKFFPRQENSERFELIGTSDAIKDVKRKIINSSDMRILFLGETGVGKSLFAKWSNMVLCNNEKRKRPFFSINCANIKHERLADELFGHVRGAFTGAISDKKGLVELAEGGELFLDEIGDLDSNCQAELLTYLDNYEFFKMGSSKRERSRVRILSASNKNIEKMVARGTFRKDLYSRISQSVIKIPPLRFRKEDIRGFVKYFVKMYSGFEKPVKIEIEKIYKKYHWREGNVRELNRACQYMCFQAKDSDKIFLEHMDPVYNKREFRRDDSFEYDLSDLEELGYFSFLKKIEGDLLLKVIRLNESIRKNSKRLKIDRGTLTRKIQSYKIPILNSKNEESNL